MQRPVPREMSQGELIKLIGSLFICMAGEHPNEVANLCGRIVQSVLERIDLQFPLLTVITTRHFFFARYRLYLNDATKVVPFEFGCTEIILCHAQHAEG